jgi:hypothetical protein
MDFREFVQKYCQPLIRQLSGSQESILNHIERKGPYLKRVVEAISEAIPNSKTEVSIEDNGYSFIVTKGLSTEQNAIRVGFFLSEYQVTEPVFSTFLAVEIPNLARNLLEHERRIQPQQVRRDDRLDATTYAMTQAFLFGADPGRPPSLSIEEIAAIGAHLDRTVLGAPHSVSVDDDCTSLPVSSLIDYAERVDILAPSDRSRSGAITGGYRLQERCRTCINRNKDFDKQVAPEHLEDLKCAINPSYAMSGVGECADFIEDSAPVSEPIAELPQLSNGDRPSLINLLTDAIRAIPSVRRIDLDGYRSPNGWEYRLKVTKHPENSQHFIISPHALNPDTFPAMVNGITARILEGDRPSLSPFTVHPWNRIQVSGDCPISTSRAEEYLAPSCSARNLVYRKHTHIPALITPCETIVNGAYEEITVPIEIIKVTDPRLKFGGLQEVSLA